MRRRPPEQHFIGRIGWLRAAVLGANDGIISTASLIVGVAAASNSPAEILTAGIAGMVAGAMSMAAGEFVSVSSQSDTERADLAREKRELSDSPEAEAWELAQIYVRRGVEPETGPAGCRAAHGEGRARRSCAGRAGHLGGDLRPAIQAAFTSALTFSTGAALPIVAMLAAPPALHRAAGLRRLDPVPGAPRRHRCPGRRRRFRQADAARGVLGRACHGGDGGRRRLGGNSGVGRTHPAWVQ